MQKHTNSHCMNKDSHTQLAGFDLIKTVQYTEKKRKDKTRQVWRIKEAAIQAPMKSTHFGLWQSSHLHSGFHSTNSLNNVPPLRCYRLPGLLLPHTEIGKVPKCTCYVPGPELDCKFLWSKPSSKPTNPLTFGLIALTTLNVVTARIAAHQQTCCRSFIQNENTRLTFCAKKECEYLSSICFQLQKHGVKCDGWIQNTQGLQLQYKWKHATVFFIFYVYSIL